jgi:hypothetical protein
MPELIPMGSRAVPGNGSATWLVLKSLTGDTAIFGVQPHALAFVAMIFWGIWPFWGSERLHDLGGGTWSISGLGGNTNYLVRAGQNTGPGQGTYSDVTFRTS